MTREEAIRLLKSYLDEEIHTRGCIDAHRMAIKALEQEPCEDSKAHSKKEEGRPVVLPYRERKCRRCKYGDAYELQKPCIVYSEKCELFTEKE